MINTLKKLVENKSVLLLGFGREGKSTYNALLKAGGYTKIAIADINNVTAPNSDVQVFSGESYQDVMESFDVVFKSPGIVLNKPIDEYLCKVTSQTNVFMEHFSNQIIGITGTKGKSTTTTLLYHILSNSNVNSVMVGNIGIPCFDKADEITEDCKIVFEFSCHQLEYAEISPHISVLINLYEEHLDHYGTKEKYFYAKQNIYRYQTERDVLFCGVQCRDMVSDCKSKITTVSGNGEIADIMVFNQIVNYKENKLEIPTDEIKLIGEHNYFNIGTVYGISKELGVSDTDFLSALKTYTPPPHRLEYAGKFNEIDFYDDSISTISETCINAIKFVPNIATILIGGMDRGIDYTQLEDFLISDSIENVIFMEASGKRIYNQLDKRGQLSLRFKLVENLEEAVELAKVLTPKNKACVMSPAAASYGIFKDFEQRGEFFKKLISE